MNASIKLLLTVASVMLLAGCEAKIQQGLDERQANEIVTALLERGYQPRKELEAGKKPTWSIVVDSDHSDDATRVLVELGLPREKQPTAADLIKPGLVPSPNEEFQLKVIGLQGDLSRTLESVDGVIAARVHLVVSPPARAGQLPVTSKASAFLRVRAGKANWMNAHRDELRSLVAGSVEGLALENVTLVVNEVAAVVPTRPVANPTEGKLRFLAVLLGTLLSVVSAALVVMVLRKRAPRRVAPVHPARTQTPPQVAKKAA